MGTPHPFRFDREKHHAHCRSTTVRNQRSAGQLAGVARARWARGGAGRRGRTCRRLPLCQPFGAGPGQPLLRRRGREHVAIVAQFLFCRGRAGRFGECRQAAGGVVVPGDLGALVRCDRTGRLVAAAPGGLAVGGSRVSLGAESFRNMGRSGGRHRFGDHAGCGGYGSQQQRWTAR